MFKKILFLYATFFLLYSNISWADVWVIANIRTDVESSNELEAKKLAIEKAKIQAVDYLFKRIIVPQDQPITVEKWPLADIDIYIEAIVINKEQFGGGRYVATMTISFVKERVIDYIRSKKYRYSIQETSNILVLPLFYNGEFHLWGNEDSLSYSNNYVYQAFKKLIPNHSLVKFIIPVGDQDDKNIISSQQLKNLDAVALSTIAAKYNVEMLLVVRIDESYVASSAFLNTDAKLLGIVWDHIHYQWQSQVAIGKNIQEVIDDTAVKIHTEIVKNWKQAHSIDSDSREKRYAVQAYFSTLQEWEDMKSQLFKINGLSNVTIHNFSIDHAEIVLQTVLSSNDLLKALEEHHFSIRKGAAHPILVFKK